VHVLQALLIAMEQGEVSIAKAGMVATLPARTAVLAAANPKNGMSCYPASLSQVLNLPCTVALTLDIPVQHIVWLVQLAAGS
jgi:replicative DNA helicase Mcm